VTKRVLVVEDNELNLKLFCDLLRAHGFIAEPVRDGRDAIPRAHECLPDLVITDIQLPHVTGIELITLLRSEARLAHVPIMAVTAYAGREDEERARAAGANAYVTKPIALARFIEEVRALLAEAPAGE
jgi:two-component system cell cycle response regulator DivK